MIKKETIKVFAAILLIIMITTITPANNVTLEQNQTQREATKNTENKTETTLKEQIENNTETKEQANKTVTEDKNTTEVKTNENNQNPGNQTNISIKENKTEETKTAESTKEILQTTQRKEVENIKKSEQEIKQNVTKTAGIDKQIKTATENNTEEKINHVFYDKGKKSFELETKEKELPEITKTEIIEEKEKQVTISSKEHVTTPIKVYSDLQKEVKKEEIKIFWENEDAFITDIEYFDENNNGLIERVAWTVPHLSEQIYKIILETTTENTTEERIDIEAINPPSGNEQNPINFSFNVKYNKTENLNCTLRIENSSGTELYSKNEDIEGESINLPNDTYIWTYHCFDNENDTIENATGGTFTIAEHFYTSGLKKTYLRNWNGEIYGNSDYRMISIMDEIGSQVTTYIEKVGGQKSINYSKPSTTQNIFLNNTNIFDKGVHKINSFYTTDRLEKPYHLEQEFSVAQIDITQPTEITENEEASISININSPTENIGYLLLSFGDGEIFTTSANSLSFDQTIKHNYTQAGSKNVEVTFSIGSETYTLSRGSIQVNSAEDDEEPEITLINPTNNKKINTDTITFKFEVDDNIKVKTCNFSIYNTTFNSYSSSTRVYTKKYDNPTHGETIELELKDFEQRQYAWEVECEDNSSNYDFEANFFEVDLNDSNSVSQTSSSNNDELEYERKDEVRELMDKATAFIEKEEQFTAEERDALNDLKIMEEVKTYKKRLLDIEQYLGKNYKFTADDALRDKMITDYNNEIDSIKENMVTDFKVKEKYEYVKNGNTLNWNEIIKEYIDKTKTKLSSSINALAEENKEKQQQISVATIIKKIELDYSEGSEEITLIKKKVDIEDNSEKVLEIIPENLLKDSEEIEFITTTEEISKNHIYEISTEDINEDQIIYYIKGSNTKLKDFEEVDTVLFTETTEKKGIGSTISGFLVLDSDRGIGTTNILLIIIVIVAIIISSLWIISRMKKRKIKRDPNAQTILTLIDKIRVNLKEGNIDEARENYKKIQETYKELPSEKKKGLYKLLKRANLAIDKKDIWNLVKDYQKARNNFEKREAMESYEKIKKIYTRLPKKDRAKILKIVN